MKRKTHREREADRCREIGMREREEGERERGRLIKCG